MKRGDANSLTQIPCPLCKLGQAVHRSAAYKVFTSKKYIKLRKARKQAQEKLLPTIGKNTNLEVVLLDSAAAEFLNPPPRPPITNPMDWLLHHSWVRTILGSLLVVSSIWLVLWLLEQGLAEVAAKILGQLLFIGAMAGFWGLWYWFDRIAEKLESEEIKRWHKEDQMTWVCLRCRQSFQWELSPATYRKKK